LRKLRKIKKKIAMKVNVVGAGLAGCEATYQLIKRNIPVALWEMRPGKNTEIHQSGDFAELVCSNSLRSNDVLNAVGLLKNEMRKLDSLIMKTADETAIPAGSALAVDRKTFSKKITAYLHNHSLVEVINKEYKAIDNKPTIITSGPLTSEILSKEIMKLLGRDYLYFYDAVAPIVTFESVDLNKAYFKSRYDKGEADYLNCPMTKEEFTVFYDALINAEVQTSREFAEFFSGCLPIEEMAKKGEKTLLFGPMKPVGLKKDEQQPYAVVQLRQDNYANTLFNIVGFQTQLKWLEQKRVLRLVPGLENCEIVRYGVMHRNTYINSPLYLDNNYRYLDSQLFFAGQLTGVEGYVESAASGLLAGINMANMLINKPLLDIDSTTMIGSMANYIAKANSHDFKPMNANYGIIEPLIGIKKIDKKMEYLKRSERSIKELQKLI